MEFSIDGIVLLFSCRDRHIKYRIRFILVNFLAGLIIACQLRAIQFSSLLSVNITANSL